MKMSVQVALYPLNTLDAAAVIGDILDKMNWEGVEVGVGNMSTVISGEEHLVWSRLQELCQKAALDHQIVLTATLSNECGCEGGCDADYRGQNEGAALKDGSRAEYSPHSR